VGGEAHQVHAEVDDFPADVQMAPGALIRFAEGGIGVWLTGRDGVQGGCLVRGVERNKNTNEAMWASFLFRLA
jgi:hypothetical protein